MITKIGHKFYTEIDPEQFKVDAQARIDEIEKKILPVFTDQKKLAEGKIAEVEAERDDLKEQLKQIKENEQSN